MKRGAKKVNRMESVCLFVDPRQLDLFETVADKRKTTRSEVMREALNTGYETLKRKRKKAS